ncbi:alpha/beta hydrolase [Fulvivirgaceae bacterium BMA10]|uniref:Alpha/beta hydrolase n=1 Tax=Splendidivirga corallicola TaxID=3051826 RepID=A0ABT8KP80_9BACT|nr:alpha/beta hydrolase [Fulvivirgaceae bacterium BMA10]
MNYSSQKINGIHFLAGNWPLKASLPTLLFVHGGGITGIMWERQVQELREVCNTMAVDLPGHGGSEGNGFNSVDDYAIALNKLVKNIDNQNFILCGHSFGGAIVQQMILNEPDDFKACILISTGAMLKMDAKHFGGVREAYQESQNELNTLFPDVSLSTRVLMGDFFAYNKYNREEEIKSLSLPTLVMVGADDIITPPAQSQDLHERIQGSEYKIIADAGHNINLHQPAAIELEIKEFIERVVG